MSNAKNENSEILNAQYRLAATDEFEEINSEEVDRVVEALDRLIAGVQSENIKHYLEEAASNIYYLVYEDEADQANDDITQAACSIRYKCDVDRRNRALSATAGDAIKSASSGFFASSLNSSPACNTVHVPFWPKK